MGMQCYPPILGPVQAVCTCEMLCLMYLLNVSVKQQSKIINVSQAMIITSLTGFMILLAILTVVQATVDIYVKPSHYFNHILVTSVAFLLCADT